MLRRRRISQTTSALYFSDESSKRLSYSLAWGVGSEIGHHPAAGLRPFLGQGQGLTARVTFRPDPQARIDGTWIEHEMRSGPQEVYRERMWRLRVARQITRRWSVRAIADINTPKADPRLVAWDAARSMSSDVLGALSGQPLDELLCWFHRRVRTGAVPHRLHQDVVPFAALTPRRMMNTFAAPSCCSGAPRWSGRSPASVRPGGQSNPFGLLRGSALDPQLVRL